MGTEETKKLISTPKTDSKEIPIQEQRKIVDKSYSDSEKPLIVTSSTASTFNKQTEEKKK